MKSDSIILADSFLQWRWFRRSKMVSVFLFLLLSANEKDSYCFSRMLVKRGSLIATNEMIANECGLTIQNVRTALANLEATGEIKREHTNRYQIITITNYESYKG